MFLSHSSRSIFLFSLSLPPSQKEGRKEGRREGGREGGRKEVSPSLGEDKKKI